MKWSNYEEKARGATSCLGRRSRTSLVHHVQQVDLVLVYGLDGRVEGLMVKLSTESERRRFIPPEKVPDISSITFNKLTWCWFRV